MSFKTVMTREQRPRSGMALGGLGTGSFELRQDGLFYNWSIFNNEPLALGAPLSMKQLSLLFFVVRYQERGGTPQLRMLQIEPSHDAASLEGHQFHYILPWLNGVDRIDYDASFPFCRLKFQEDNMPFTVEMTAWSPFIPHDAKNSALPVAFFDFTIKAKGNKTVDVMIMTSLRNAVGYDVQERTYATRHLDRPGHRIAEMTCEGMDPTHSSFGSMALSACEPDSSYYLGWEHLHPYYETVLRNKTLPNIDDTDGRNSTDKTTGKRQAMARLFSTVGASEVLSAKNKQLRRSFAFTWCFPNRWAQAPHNAWSKPPAAGDHIAGHYYSNFFNSAAEVADYAIANRGDLYERTLRFHKASQASSLPAYVNDQINSQLNTFITSSWFTKDGHFGIVEGLDPERSYAGLSTMDVMMYGGVATAALFPELDRKMLLAYARFQAPKGSVAHSIARNLRELPAGETDGHRVDLPGQFVYLSLRAYFSSGDRAFLDQIWPAAKKAIEYVLRERDKNGDGLPDMEGVMCSYDNFPMYGISSFVAAQWLAALALAVKAARVMSDDEACQRYTAIYEQGRIIFEQRLWNGRYYRLCNDEGGAKGIVDEGCMTDQLLGQWAAHLAGLGHLFDPKHIRRALQHVMKVNYHPEQGVRNCSWPKDGYLHDVDKDVWVDQANTCWTGTELALAGLLIQEGLFDEGMTVIRNVDDRYRRWGMYWDHQEFGGHYYRPMSAWGIVAAALGFSDSDGCVTFDPQTPERPSNLLWVTADGYGHYKLTATSATVRVLSGCLKMRQLRIRPPNAKTKAWKLRINGQTIDLIRKQGFLTAAFSEDLCVAAGAEITLRPA